MSTALAKRGGSTAVVVDLDRLDFDRAFGALDRITKKAGIGAGGGARVAPGETYQFKKGWKRGTGKKAVEIDPPRFVVNVPHTGVFFQKFEELDGKWKVSNSPVAVIMAGNDLVDRESLGDNDVEAWDEYKGDLVDPWSCVVMMPVRYEGETEYHNVQASKGRKVSAANPEGEIKDSGVSNANALTALFREALAELKTRPGMLPVVQFGERKLSNMSRTTNARGKVVVEKNEWEAIGYEVVGWVKAEPCDRLNQSVDLGDDTEVDAGEVTATARVEHKPSAAPAQKSKKKVADL